MKPAETQFRASEPLVEFNNAGLKEELLRGMAAATGGQYYDYGHTQQLAENVLQQVRAAKDAGWSNAARAAVGHAAGLRGDPGAAGRRVDAAAEIGAGVRRSP